MKILLLLTLTSALAAALQLGAGKVQEFLDAIRKGDLIASRALLDSNPGLKDVRTPDAVSAARFAMYCRSAEIARMLIARGAALDLYDAAATGEISQLRRLVASDPNSVNTHSKDGATPLALAAFLGQRAAAEFLLDHGAKVNMLSINPAFPFAPLHSAMSAGHRDIVYLLLAHGADVRVREGGGMTALHEAAGIGSVEYVQLLLSRGADPSAKTDNGKLPVDFARERNHAAVVELLTQGRR